MWPLKNLCPGDLFFLLDTTLSFTRRSLFFFVARPESSRLGREQQRIKKLYDATEIRNACSAAARVLTVAEFSRECILDTFPVSPEKAAHVYNGVGDNYSYEGTR